MERPLCASPKARGGQPRAGTCLPLASVRCWWPAGHLLFASARAPTPRPNSWNLTEASLLPVKTQTPRGGPRCPSSRGRGRRTGEQSGAVPPRSGPVRQARVKGTRVTDPGQPGGRRPAPGTHRGTGPAARGWQGSAELPAFLPVTFAKGHVAPELNGGSVGDLGPDAGVPSPRATGQEEAGRRGLTGAGPACPRPHPSCPVPVGWSPSAASHTLSTHTCRIPLSLTRETPSAGGSPHQDPKPLVWGLVAQRSAGRPLRTPPGCAILPLGPGDGPRLRRHR